VRKSLLKLLGVVVALTLSAHAYAVGMGGINVTSALGQTLKADIELVAVGQADKASLVARLAPPEVYKSAGLVSPSGNQFGFQIESRANGGLYLKVSSAQPLNDPFVSILVELTWSSGKLLRGYTFLLDPPGYVPEQPPPADVQAVAPAVQPAPAETAAKAAEQAAAVAAAPVGKKSVSVAPSSRAEAGPKAKHNQVAAGSVTVKRGDTLNNLSAQNKPDNVSLERMLVALYRANADQFDGNNMNRIKVGKILRLPSRDELAKVTQPEAVREIRAQAADWNTYRQKLASAASDGGQPQAAKQVVTGKITSSVVDKTPVAKESAREVLKLSKGETPGDMVGTGATGKAATAQEMKNAAQENAISKAKAAREEQVRAALLEKNIKDMQRLAELKSVVAAPQPSLVDRILSEPFYLAGIAAVVLGLGGLGLMLSGGSQTRASGDAGAITGQIAVPSPEIGDEDASQQAAATERKLEPDNPLYGAAGTIGHADSAAAQITALDATTGAVPVDTQQVPAAAPDVGYGLNAPAAQPEPAQAENKEVELKLDFTAEKSAPVAQTAEDILAGISLNLDDAVAPSESKPENREERWHEVATKLDLAKAYQEMGDASGAREILAEVMQEGDAAQRTAAQAQLDQLG
jgi:FimV-like protein